MYIWLNNIWGSNVR